MPNPNAELDFDTDTQSLSGVEKFAAFWLSPNDCSTCSTWRAAAIVIGSTIPVAFTFAIVAIMIAAVHGHSFMVSLAWAIAWGLIGLLLMIGLWSLFVAWFYRDLRKQAKAAQSKAPSDADQIISTLD